MRDLVTWKDMLVCENDRVDLSSDLPEEWVFKFFKDGTMECNVPRVVVSHVKSGGQIKLKLICVDIWEERLSYSV